MGKVLKVLAVVVAIAVVVFAPQLIPQLIASSFIAAAVTAAVVIGATVALSVLLAPKPSTQTPSPSVFRQAVANSFIVYGKRRVGGLLVFFHSKKNVSDGKHYRYFVIACAGHRCQGVTDWMLNDDVVTVNGSNMVTSGPYASAAWLWFVRGTATDVANATFVSECDGKWTSNHKGLGIAKIYAKFRMNDDVIEAGMPNITAVIEGKDDIHDPRDDSTGYTNNAALVFDDWMKLAREEGGFGAYEDEMPSDEWVSAQANVCDETVEGEPRYTLNGVITTGAAPSEVRDTLVTNCAGSYTFSEGRHLLRVGYWVPPSETLSEDNLAGGIIVSPFVEADVAANEIQGTFYDPDANYQAAAFTTKTTDPAPDDVKQQDLDMPFVTSRYQAERVATIMLRRAACEKTVTWPMDIEGLKVAALNVVQLGTDRYGLSNYAFVVKQWTISGDFGVTAIVREENEEIYEDPEPTVPDSVPAISVPEPLVLDRDLSVLIANSYTSPTAIASATDTEITIDNHDRLYSDLGVAVTGTVLDEDTDSDALVVGETYGLSYDDPDREGGAVTWQAHRVSTGHAADAYTSPDNPTRHFGGFITMDMVGGTGTTGGGSYAPGSGPGGEIPAP